MLGELVSLIKKKNNILLLTHKDGAGDGDALGSLLSLSLTLNKIGKNVIAFSDGPVLSHFNFLPKIEILNNHFNKNVLQETELVLFLDFGDIDRSVADKNTMSEIFSNFETILVDHHPLGTLHPFVRHRIWDTKAAAATELIYFLVRELGVSLDSKIATCLLTGIFTDTNSFQNPNATSQTYRVASRLLDCGARVEKISSFISQDKSSTVLQLWGKAMSRLWYNSKYNLYITAIKEQDFLENKISKEEINGLTNFLNLHLDGNKAGLLVLIESDGKIKGSLRTIREEIDVSALAKLCGGGGHKKAAGFEIEGRLYIANSKWQIV